MPQGLAALLVVVATAVLCNGESELSNSHGMEGACPLRIRPKALALYR